MSRQENVKPCGCGRGKLLTGENSKYNARDKEGRQVCGECLIDEIRESIG